MPISVSLTQGGKGNLKRLAKLADDEVKAKALVAAGLLVVNAAKAKAPYQTGNLRRSIHIGGHTDATPLQSTTGTDIGGEEKNAILVGTNVEYAARQEYGFSGEDSLGRSYNQPARPFLRPALDENVDDVRREFEEALSDLIQAKVRKV